MTIKQYSPRALELLGLTPIDSVWAEGNRPIYDRLPAISEGYKKSFEFGQHGKVMEGCEPLFDVQTGRMKIRRGSISWYEGSTAFPEYNIDIPKTSGRWVIIGELVKNVQGVTLESIPFNWGSLLGYDVGYIGDGYVKNPTQFAFLDDDRRWLPSSDGVSDYHYLGVSFEHGAELTGVRLYGEGDALMCLNPDEMSVTRTDVPDGEGYWEINFEDTAVRNELKVYFHSGSASVRYFVIEGRVYIPRRNWSSGISEHTVGLGLYDLSALADEEKRMCPFCSFQVGRDGVVRDFRDTRVFTPEGNEPVAMWITEGIDHNLMDLFSDVKDYKVKWMDSRTSAYHLYEREVTSVNVR
jgi:hypothetical protein